MIAVDLTDVLISITECNASWNFKPSPFAQHVLNRKVVTPIADKVSVMVFHIMLWKNCCAITENLIVLYPEGFVK